MNETVRELLDALVQKGVSDLHLTSGEPPRLRGAGHLETSGFPACSAEQVDAMTRDLVGEANFRKFAQEHELDLAVSAPNGSRLRINLYYQQGKIAWAVRALPSKFFPLEALGIDMKVLALATEARKGLILVTGATGSGKSTTLASIINRINETRDEHIFTIEDPVEYIHPSKKSFVSQREVGSDTGSFHEALRRVLREDPDVVLIGETRDRETMAAALTLAETGHLTFGTLHTSGAVQTVGRIVGAFPADEQDQVRLRLADTLNLVISQQLVPWDEGGGRSLVAEVMVATPAIKAMIRENKLHQLQSTLQTGSTVGMKTMNASLYELFAKGLITQATALSWSPDKEELRRTLDNATTAPEGLCEGSKTRVR